MAARKKLKWLEATFLACAIAVSTAPAFAVTDADRVAVYKDFRAQFDAKKYAEAQPLAERLVQLTEQQYGADELQLTNPLTNLGTVHYKLGNFAAAIENFQHSLRILQAKSTIADKQQIRPLHGLGVSFLGANDPESAVVALKRAADLSRNTDGLYNINQVEFIDPLVEAYQATGRFVEAEKETQYAMRVEEAAYGRSSIKLLGRLDKLARWYEDQRRYTTERAVYERALTIIGKAGDDNDLRRVLPLRGIARAFRLEVSYGVEGTENNGLSNAADVGAKVFNNGSDQRRGESSLTSALAVIDAGNPPDQKLRGEVLTDLGDWYLITNATKRAYDSYSDAWKAFEQAGSTRLLEAPRVLVYRGSVSSVDRSQLDPASAVVKTVELHLRVDRDGRVDDVTSPTTDVSDSIVKNSVASMRRSRFAPRMENGIPVATDNVVFRESVLVRVTPPSSTAPGATPSGTAPSPPASTAPEKKEEASPPAPSAPPAGR
jgi:tetratricopeptide (TPR) repeat protein